MEEFASQIVQKAEEILTLVGEGNGKEAGQKLNELLTKVSRQNNLHCAPGVGYHVVSSDTAKLLASQVKECAEAFAKDLSNESPTGVSHRRLLKSITDLAKELHTLHGSGYSQMLFPHMSKVGDGYAKKVCPSASRNSPHPIEASASR